MITYIKITVKVNLYKSCISTCCIKKVGSFIWGQNRSFNSNIK